MSIDAMSKYATQGENIQPLNCFNQAGRLIQPVGFNNLFPRRKISNNKDREENSQRLRILKSSIHVTEIQPKKVSIFIFILNEAVLIFPLVNCLERSTSHFQ